MNRNSNGNITSIHLKPLRSITSLILSIMIIFISCIFINAIAETVTSTDYAYPGDDYFGIDQAAKSVFFVKVFYSDPQKIATASGFVMFDEHLFITNQHVIQDALYLEIEDEDGNQYILNKVVISDAEDDIAILLFPDGYKYKPLEYDSTFTNLKRGQRVLAIGSPIGFAGTVSDGIISAFPIYKGYRSIQITAPISHGSSGGCLLNEDLKVIGVTSGGVDKGSNIGWAVPVFIVEELYSQWNKVDTVTLGTEAAWDTVGYGLHDSINGIAEKPTVTAESQNTATPETSDSTGDVASEPESLTETTSDESAVAAESTTPAHEDKAEIAVNEPADRSADTMSEPETHADQSTPVSDETPAAESTVSDTEISSTVYLDLVWDPSIQRYVLVIDGNAIAMNQPAQSAIAVCNANGLNMSQEMDGDFAWGFAVFDQKIIFIKSLEVTGSFTINPAVDNTISYIDFNISENVDNVNAIKQITSETFQTLQERFGRPTGNISIWDGVNRHDAQTNDIIEAIQLMDQIESDYCTVSIQFENLTFDIVKFTFQNNTVYYCMLTLTSWL